MPDKQRQLRKIQKLLAEGFDLGSGPLAPFLAEPENDKQGVIDRVQGDLAVLESGEVIPVREIYNPDSLNLEGALYDHGQAFSMDHVLEDLKKKREGILERQRSRREGEGTVLREAPKFGIIDRVMGENAVLETGELIPVDQIRNPDEVNLEGAVYDRGTVRYATEQRDKNRGLLNKIKDR